MLSSRDIVLRKIRRALEVNPILPKHTQPHFKEQAFSDSREQDLKLLFAEQFSAVGGSFIYCEQPQQLLNIISTLLIDATHNNKVYCPHEELQFALQDLSISWENQPTEADVSITNCRYLIARTGSIIVDDKRNQLTSIASPIHIVIANDKQILFDLGDILNEEIADKVPVISIITGPSRTADIEKTLVVGVHGTKQLFVILTASPS